jgi:hypothetical protein
VHWTVERLSLVESTLAPGGSRYREVAGWALGSDAGVDERAMSGALP